MADAADGAAGGTRGQDAADPNNSPFSNEARAASENKIAELVARDLGDSLQRVNDVLQREKPAIDGILADYGVPRVD